MAWIFPGQRGSYEFINFVEGKVINSLSTCSLVLIAL